MKFYGNIEFCKKNCKKIKHKLKFKARRKTKCIYTLNFIRIAKLQSIQTMR